MKIYDPFPRAPDSVPRISLSNNSRAFALRTTTVICVSKSRPGVRVLKSGKKRIVVK